MTPLSVVLAPLHRAQRKHRLPSIGWLALLISFLAAQPCHAQASWPRPLVLPLAESVTGVSNPAVPLNGSWKFTLTPPANFWLPSVNPSSWTNVAVPGEPWMQGLKIQKDIEYPYKRDLSIPSDFAGQRVFLRFDGVYSVGRVWIDGQLAGEHDGGFTRWQVDITSLVTPGSTHQLTVSIRDKSDDLSFASGYAGRYLGADVPHNIGGILRDVTLFALPTTHLTRLHAITHLDEQYTNATLELKMGAAFTGNATSAEVRFRLKDPAGADVVLSPASTTLTSASPATNLSVPVSQPKLWDAEHPWLYTLEADLMVDGNPIQTLRKRIGFREVEMAGNRMLVNGKEVKLRGGNRHSVHPLTGRADFPGMEEIDVKLYKEANINYIRTSHYPTTERFVDLCDQYGIYLEEEMAIVWLDHGASNSLLAGQSSSAAARPYFMRQISETLERDLSHPSIIIWSIGNENVQWGTNFRDERDYARAEDPTRVLKTGHNHYSPGWNTDEYLDLDAYHYPSWNSNFNKTGKPYLFDEYCHVMTYYSVGSIAEIDPNIRNFWGESLKRFWDGIFPSSGSLGGAIWGTIDDIFYTPDAAIGYGGWGIFDGWRREKPEWWLTKKGYSPVQIANVPLGNPGTGNPLVIPVKNWFDHTNFSELVFTWKVKGEEGTIAASLAPHTTGQLTIPGRNWQTDDEIYLTVTAQQPGYNYIVDEFLLRLQEPGSTFPGPQGPAPSLTQNATEVIVAGTSFQIIFDKITGQIRSGTYQGQQILTGGPKLNLTPSSLPSFTASSVTAQTNGNQVEVTINGNYGTTTVAFILRIDGAGRIETTYTVTSPPSGASNTEVGIAFRVSEDCDRLEWDRKGLYSLYPPDHIGRNQGRAIKMRPGPAIAYRVEPSWSWSLDMEDFHQNGPNHTGYGMTNDFRSSKEYIRHATVLKSANGVGLRAESDGASHAVRMGFPRGVQNVIDDRDASITYQGTWTSYADANDYNGTERFSKTVGAYAEYAFSGTAVRYIGARNHNLGKVDILLDGTLTATVDAYAATKQYQQTLFEIANLTPGNHTLRVVVRGDKNAAASDTYALIDGFSPVAATSSPGLWMHINRRWAYDLGWGNYGRTSTIPSGFSDTVRLRFVSTPVIPAELSLDAVKPDSQGKVHLSWPSQSMGFYTLEASEDLETWGEVSAYLPAQGEITEYTDDLFTRLGRIPDKCFYRVKAYEP